jgi:hypothetical protein
MSSQKENRWRRFCGSRSFRHEKLQRLESPSCTRTTRSQSSRWLVVGILAAGLLYPWHSMVAPAVRVQILDEAGEPARGVIMRQNWGHFNLSSDSHEYARTDDNGYVAFPDRHVRGSLLLRFRSARSGSRMNPAIISCAR